MASIIKANQLQDFGGNSILTSDGSGVVTPNASGIKNTPAFQAYASASQTYGNTNTVIQVNTEVFDSGSAYDTSTYKFTPQVAGKYYFYGQIWITSPGTNLNMEAKLTKSGTEFAVGDINSAVNRDQAVVVHAMVDLNGSTDYVQLLGYNSSSKSTFVGSKYTYFGGYRMIGA